MPGLVCFSSANENNTQSMNCVCIVTGFKERMAMTNIFDKTLIFNE